MQLQRIKTAPDNLVDYIEEIGPAYEALYGHAAARHYRSQAAIQMAATIAHTSIHAYGVVHQLRTVALIFVQNRTGRYAISFFHVLTSCPFPDAAQALLKFVLQDLSERSNLSVITDYLAFCPLDVDQTYEDAGFVGVTREFMRRPCTARPPDVSEGYVIRTAIGDDLVALSDVLYASYIGHAEIPLHEEVQSVHAAHEFLLRCTSGHYGPCPRDYIVGAWADKECIGLVVGAELVSEFGYVLHMAVLPAHRGCRVGTHLLNAINTRFFDHGLTCAALVVTSDNPARRLYERFDFESLRSFPVYYRQTP